MRLVIIMKLSSMSLKNHVFPITKLNSIEKITVVRDTPGPEIEKVMYLDAARFGVPSSFLGIPIKLFLLVRSALREKPVLIHSYLLFPHGYLAFVAGKVTGRKVGVSLIAGPVETYLFGKNPIGKYSYCQTLPQSNILNALSLSILKKFDVITVTGTFTRNYLIEKGVERDKIWILPHVVDEIFRPLDMKKDYDVLFIGRLVQVKHVETIIRAILIAKKTLPQIKMAIVGDGEERSNLEKISQSLGLSEQIDFVGYQANTWEWYNRSKISLVSSEREGFPYTVIESLKCGVPVIVSNCGDVTDIVKDTYNGRIIADYRDSDAYAERIIELLTNTDLLNSYSRNCLKSFETEISEPVEKVWDQILNHLIT